jgi:hypothetical protein
MWMKFYILWIQLYLYLSGWIVPAPNPTVSIPNSVLATGIAVGGAGLQYDTALHSYIPYNCLCLHVHISTAAAKLQRTVHSQVSLTVKTKLIITIYYTKKLSDTCFLIPFDSYVYIINCTFYWCITEHNWQYRQVFDLLYMTPIFAGSLLTYEKIIRSDFPRMFRTCLEKFICA